MLPAANRALERRDCGSGSCTPRPSSHSLAKKGNLLCAPTVVGLKDENRVLWRGLDVFSHDWRLAPRTVIRGGFVKPQNFKSTAPTATPFELCINTLLSTRYSVQHIAVAPVLQGRQLLKHHSSLAIEVAYCDPRRRILINVLHHQPSLVTQVQEQL